MVDRNMNTPGEFTKRLARVFLFVFLLVLAGGQAVPAVSAVEPDPLSQIKGAVQEILQILNDEELQVPARRSERKKLVLAVIDRAFDFRTMSMYALGRRWKERTPVEQDRFVELFAKLVKYRYIGKIENYSGQEVFFKGQRIKGNRALIDTTLNDKDKEISIIYKLIKNENMWQAYDMRIENVSLTANYRGDFYSIIKKEDYSGLIKRLEEKVRTLAELW